jgi:uncharacterized membrane protein
MKTPMELVSPIVLLPVLLTGVVFWFAARTRRGLLFGVSVPLAFADGPLAKHLIARYRLRIVLLTIATAVSCLPALMRNLPWLTTVMFSWLLIGGLVLWQLARQKMKGHAIVAPLERSAGIAADSGTGAAWFAIMAFALAPLARTWLYLQRHWEEIPARFPVHFDIYGVANRWSVRSEGAVATPLIVGAAIIAFIVGIAAFIRFASVVERQRAVRVLLPTLAVISWSLSLVFCWTALMPLHAFGSKGLMIFLLVQLSIVIAIVAWMMWQLMRTQGTDAYDGTPDAMWRMGGMVYYNPSDDAVLVPKRLGWGWTLNFGRPAAWSYLGGLLLLAAAVGVVPFLLK